MFCLCLLRTPPLTPQMVIYSLKNSWQEMETEFRKTFNINLLYLVPPPPSPPVPLKGPPLLPFATFASPQKVTLKVWPWPFLSKFSSSCPPNLTLFYILRDPGRIFKGHLDRVLRNEIYLIQRSNSWTWIWQKTRVLCFMLFIDSSTGKFYKKPYSTLVLKFHKIIRETENRIYS